MRGNCLPSMVSSIFRLKFNYQRKIFVKIKNTQCYSIKHSLSHTSKIYLDYRPMQDRRKINFSSSSQNFNNTATKFYGRPTSFLDKTMESNENLFAHSVLLSLPNNRKTTIDYKLLLQDVDGVYISEIKATNIFFNILNSYTGLESSSMYDAHESVSQYAVKQSYYIYKTIPDEILLKIMLSSIPAVTINPAFFSTCISIFKAIRRVTIERLLFWTTDQILLVADIWYALKFDHTYIHEAIKILGNQLNNLTPSQAVQLFFYMNITRKNTVSNSLEPLINNILSDINFEELGIVCLGLFKTKTPINDYQIFDKVARKMVSSIDLASDISLSAVLKFIRFNFAFCGASQKNIDLCKYLLSNLKPHLRSFNAYCLIQIASLGNDYCSYDKTVLQEIYDIICPILPEVRVKEMERLTYVIMNSRIYPNNCLNYFKLINDELMGKKRIDEVKLFMDSTLSCVYYLACAEYNISNSLISRTLQLTYNSSSTEEDFHVNNSLHIRRELQLCQLDKMVSMEKSCNYEGFRLAKGFSSEIIKRHLPRMPSNDMNDLSFQESSLLMIMKLLKQLNFNDKQLQLAYVLPHIPFIGIVFCTTKGGEPCNIPENFFSYLSEEIKYPVDLQDLTWNVILLATRGSYLYNSFIVRGEFLVRVSQLQKIGYKVVIVSFSDLIPKNEEQKLKNLCDALSASSLHPKILNG